MKDRTNVTIIHAEPQIIKEKEIVTETKEVEVSKQADL
jgi:hypothetical protein